LGPVPGIGDPGDADAVLMLGMHAASGTNGFLPHTLTSRLAKLVVNGRPMAEVELFAASLAPFNIVPIFFSGCPVACQQARERIRGVRTHAIDKSLSSSLFDAEGWRKRLPDQPFSRCRMPMQRRIVRKARSALRLQSGMAQGRPSGWHGHGDSKQPGIKYSS
jgi:hypothetical protein